MRSAVLFLLLLLAGSGIHAQTLPPGQYTSKSKKAIRALEEGRSAFEQKRDQQAEKFLLKAYDIDPNFIEAALGLANLYQVTARHEEAIKYYKKAIDINPKFFPNAFYFLAEAQLNSGLYEDAKNSLETYKKFERISPVMRENAARLMANATFGTEAVKHPEPFDPINAGPGINTDRNEYFPAMTADGKQFLFTRGIKVEGVPGRTENEDFFMSSKANNTWQTAVPLREINSMGNEGAPTLSADGNIMFFASCADEFGDYGSPERKGYGSCDIFYSQKVNGQWTRPRNAGSSINSNHWETQPCFSSDGKTLYFIRGVVRAGGVKEQDIYFSTVNEAGQFQPAVKLSSVVNTPLKEESVFIHPDNQTLYFSSDGHPGMGGLDIFMSRRQPNGEWGKPENIGYPINTFSDENSLLVDPAGKLAFFASDRVGGKGGLDIYYFDLPERVRPEKITYVKGKIFNAKTLEPLEASFELYDIGTQQPVTKSYSQPNGQFFVTLTSGKNYLVNVSKEGFLFYSDNFSLKDVKADFDKPFLLDIPLQPIDTGYTVELKNVFFDVNKWDLKPESMAELDKLVQFLTKNRDLKIELGGHTDNSGDRKFNMLLSANRAKAVYDYLMTKGKIEADRLSYRGYGDTRPKVANDTPENKAKNRRTEFRVTGHIN
jgi:outer membrane protein OmpA-like peptidoglycan-associated protein